MCTLAHGKRPSRRHQAAHSCGKSHEGCVHPGHLRWATPQENEADKLLHGTHMRGERNHNAKLTEDDIRLIRSLRGKLSQRAIGEKFHVSEAAIMMIHSGRNWGWLT